MALSTKICSRCKSSKLMSEFYKDKNKRDGVQTTCKECSRDYHAKYHADPSNKVKRRENALKRLYGISREQYEEMNNKQGGLCAICADPSGPPLVVDHDHKTGE